MPTFSQRLYDGIVGILPYIVLVVGAFSVILGTYALLYAESVDVVSAGLPVAFGLFLLWSGWNALRDRGRRNGDEDPGT